MKKYMIFDAFLAIIIFLLVGILIVRFRDKFEEYSRLSYLIEEQNKKEINIDEIFNIDKDSEVYEAYSHLKDIKAFSGIEFESKIDIENDINKDAFLIILNNTFKNISNIYRDIESIQIDTIALEQTAKAFYGIAKNLKGNNILHSDRYLFIYKDKNKVSEWAKEGMNWCLQENIFKIENEFLNPQAHVTWIQAIQSVYNIIIWNSKETTNQKLNNTAPVQNTEKHNNIQNEINNISKKFGAIGVAVSYIEDGKVIDSFSYGSATKGALPMTVDTKIRIASMSKAFVGLATMISVENGSMSLDANISDYWGFDVVTHYKDDIITPRAILTHTSSLMDISNNNSNTYYSNMANILRRGSAVRYIKSGNIANWNYNNYAIDVLGVTVELANNRELDDILSMYLFEPLNIDASFYGCNLDNTDLIGTLYYNGGSIARAASYTKSLCRDGIPGSRGSSFAGGLVISSYDLAKIVALLANNGVYEGARYLPTSVVDNLEYHENNFNGNFWQAQPLRYFTDTYHQDEIYTIGGDAYGAHNVLSYNPNTKKGVVILTTGANPLPDSNGATILSEISDLLYKE